MATVSNVEKKVRSLIQSGRIYYGQPTQNLEAVLARESQGWKIKCNDDIRPWGTGPNELPQEMATIAQKILYGVDVSYEVIRNFQQVDPKIVDRTINLLEKSGRSEFSPYRPNDHDLMEFLINCQIEKVDSSQFFIKTDSKHWHAFWDWLYEVKPARLPIRSVGQVLWMKRFSESHGVPRASLLYEIPDIRSRWNDRRVLAVYTLLSANRSNEVAIAESILESSQTGDEAVKAAKAAISLFATAC